MFCFGIIAENFEVFDYDILGMNFKLLKTDSNDYIRNVLYKKRLEKDT